MWEEGGAKRDKYPEITAKFDKLSSKWAEGYSESSCRSLGFGERDGNFGDVKLVKKYKK